MKYLDKYRNEHIDINKNKLINKHDNNLKHIGSFKNQVHRQVHHTTVAAGAALFGCNAAATPAARWPHAAPTPPLRGACPPQVLLLQTPRPLHAALAPPMQRRNDADTPPYAAPPRFHAVPVPPPRRSPTSAVSTYRSQAVPRRPNALPTPPPRRPTPYPRRLHSLSTPSPRRCTPVPLPRRPNAAPTASPRRSRAAPAPPLTRRYITTTLPLRRRTPRPHPLKPPPRRPHALPALLACRPRAAARRPRAGRGVGGRAGVRKVYTHKHTSAGPEVRVVR